MSGRVETRRCFGLRAPRLCSVELGSLAAEPQRCSATKASLYTTLCLVYHDFDCLLRNARREMRDFVLVIGTLVPLLAPDGKRVDSTAIRLNRTLFREVEVSSAVYSELVTSSAKVCWRRPAAILPSAWAASTSFEDRRRTWRRSVDHDERPGNESFRVHQRHWSLR